jgi:hypothetical protein
MNTLTVERTLTATPAADLVAPAHPLTRRLLPGVSRQLADAHHD